MVVCWAVETAAQLGDESVGRTVETSVHSKAASLAARKGYPLAGRTAATRESPWAV